LGPFAVEILIFGKLDDYRDVSKVFNFDGVDETATDAEQ
jgi:hypothetical protein